jgi:hypothetical protein
MLWQTVAAICAVELGLRAWGGFDFAMGPFEPALPVLRMNRAVAQFTDGDWDCGWLGCG